MTTQSTVIVAPPSPSHIVMLAMLAQAGPFAKESVIRKWNRLTKPKFRSQNLPIPSCPWCPWPSGSSREGPTDPAPPRRGRAALDVRQLTDVLHCNLQQHFVQPTSSLRYPPGSLPGPGCISARRNPDDYDGADPPGVHLFSGRAGGESRRRRRRYRDRMG